MILAVLIGVLLLSMSRAVVTQGTMLSADPNLVVGNVDPTLRSPQVNEVYDANFIPGFQVGLQNVSVAWAGGGGRGSLVYRIGPWHAATKGIPHLAVGPQCCNFREIPRTQQFRRVEWGDYYKVLAGFASPGVNVENYTSDFTSPAYVGLRTDWNWTVRVSLAWSPPSLLSDRNRWGAIGIAATQYVPKSPGKLVYTVVDFWTDDNASRAISQTAGGGVPRATVGSNVVLYHPVQLSGSGNKTIEISLSPYLKDTLNVLGLSGGTEPPVISYVYLNVEGYNFSWETSLYSFFVVSDSGSVQSTGLVSGQIPAAAAVSLAVVAVFLVSNAVGRRRMTQVMR